MDKPRWDEIETGLYNRFTSTPNQSVSLTFRPPRRGATATVMRSTPPWRWKARLHQPYPRWWRHGTPMEPLCIGTRTLFWALPGSTRVDSASLLRARNPMTSGTAEVSNTTTPGESKFTIDSGAFHGTCI